MLYHDLHTWRPHRRRRFSRYVGDVVMSDAYAINQRKRYLRLLARLKLRGALQFRNERHNKLRNAPEYAVGRQRMLLLADIAVRSNRVKEENGPYGAVSSTTASDEIVAGVTDGTLPTQALEGFSAIAPVTPARKIMKAVVDVMQSATGYFETEMQGVVTGQVNTPVRGEFGAFNEAKRKFLRYAKATGTQILSPPRIRKIDEVEQKLNSS